MRSGPVLISNIGIDMQYNSHSGMSSCVLISSIFALALRTILAVDVNFFKLLRLDLR